MSGVSLATWIGAALSAVAAVAALTGRHHRDPTVRSSRLWLVCGVAAVITVTLLTATSSVLFSWPENLLTGLSSGCLVIPVAVILARSRRGLSVVARVSTAAIVATGLVALVCGVYVVVVVGLGRRPEGAERDTLALSALAAALACGAAFPASRRLAEWARMRLEVERRSPGELLATFGQRMSRAVPMDELMLQLVETLRTTLGLEAAELWTGVDGHLDLAVSVPHVASRSLELNREELPVVAGAHAQGSAWLGVWAPALLEGRGRSHVRAVAVAHLGELLGLIVLQRRGEGPPFSEEEDRVLVELARQLGLALHNVRLDSALQASLEELQMRNEELMASRARIVAAADESRRQIERNLHDGAQQHLVALAVKVSLIRTLLDSDPAAAATMTEELGDDLRATLGELRELAHGIYPPLLRERGLGEALLTAANRSVLPVVVEADGVGRYDAEMEAAVYFCCLEAVQNAGKHAGMGSKVSVNLGSGDRDLWFEVSDDGAGFDTSSGGDGHGFVNMRDRLGAFGGQLEVRSSPGAGTIVRGTVPTPSRPRP